MEKGLFVTGDEIENGKRVIMHVDLDAFFAMCEEARRPELKGRPVIVGADPRQGKGRGVVSTANYVARKYGIGSAMPISWAWKRCPKGIYLSGDFKLYGEVSRRTFEMFKSRIKIMEKVGIDEAYFDVSDLGIDKANKLAKEMQDELFKQEKITCSFGIGPNKLIAKIASDFKKPKGITVVKDHEIKMFLNPMEVRKLHGVGKKTAERLNRIGIEKVSDMVDLGEDNLVRKFGGRWGAWLWRIANGVDNSVVGGYWERKSLGAERTFFEDVEDIRKIYGKMDSLVEKIFDDANVKRIRFRTVTIKVRYADFETHTCQKSVKLVKNLEEGKEIARNLLRPFLTSHKKIRLIGFRASGFI